MYLIRYGTMKENYDIKYALKFNYFFPLQVTIFSISSKVIGLFLILKTLIPYPPLILAVPLGHISHHRRFINTMYCYAVSITFLGVTLNTACRL